MQINLSQIKAAGFSDQAAFAKAVGDHIAALRQHQATEGEAGPIAHGLIEQAIRRMQHPIEAARPDDHAADFEIVDDTPPPPTLDERKHARVHEVSLSWQAACARVVPPLKAPLWRFQVAAAQAIDETKRTAAQVATLAAEADRRQRLLALEMHLAQLLSEIHDLTEADVEQWKAVAFPE